MCLGTAYVEKQLAARQCITWWARAGRGRPAAPSRMPATWHETWAAGGSRHRSRPPGSPTRTARNGRPTPAPSTTRIRTADTACAGKARPAPATPGPCCRARWSRCGTHRSTLPTDTATQQFLGGRTETWRGQQAAVPPSPPSFRTDWSQGGAVFALTAAHSVICGPWQDADRMPTYHTLSALSPGRGGTCGKSRVAPPLAALPVGGSYMLAA